jgi:hypothetical protein
VPLSERDQRTLKIGGIIIGVLLVVFLGMNLLGGGDEAPPGEDTARPTDPATVPGDGEPSQTLSPSPTSTLSPVAVFTGRDPFSVPPGFSTATTATTTGGTNTTTNTTTTTTTTSTSSSPGGNGSTSSSPPPTQPGGGSSVNKGGHEVVLLNVFSVNGVPTVQVEVNGTIYDVQTGDEFGPNDRFEVRSISGNCATFVYGDEPFTLCVNPQK